MGFTNQRTIIYVDVTVHEYIADFVHWPAVKRERRDK